MAEEIARPSTNEQPVIRQIEEMLDGMRAQGTHESSGSFSVDWMSALTRLDRVLDDPFLYILKLIQAGVSGSATEINVYTRDARLAVHYAGQSWPLDELQQASGYANLSGSLRLLFEGLRAALQLKLRQISILTWNGLSGFRFDLSETRSDSLALVSSPFPTSEPQSIIIIERPASWFAYFYPELEQLRQRAGYGVAPLKVNGELFHGKLGPAGRVGKWQGLTSDNFVTVYRPGRYGKSSRARRFQLGHYVYAGQVPCAPGDAPRQMVGRPSVSQAHHIEPRLGHLPDIAFPGEPARALEAFGCLPVRAELGIRCDLERDNPAYFVSHGVTLDPVAIPHRYPGIEALVSSVGLTTDLTGFKLQESEALAERLQALGGLSAQLWHLQISRYPAATRDLSVAFSLLEPGAGLRVPL